MTSEYLAGKIIMQMKLAHGPLDAGYLHTLAHHDMQISSDVLGSPILTAKLFKIQILGGLPTDYQLID